MRMVLRTDPVVRATQLKQLLVNPVDLGPGRTSQFSPLRIW